MLEPSNKHPEYMEELKKNNPAKDRKIDKDDNWYFKDSKYVSNSMLKIFQNGGIKNYDAYLNGELRVHSKAFDIGSAFHCLILEPDFFHERFHVVDDTEICIKASGADWKKKNKKPTMTTVYKKWYAELVQPIIDSGEYTVISQDDMDLLEIMQSKLLAVKEIKSLLSACDEFEGIYSNEIDGVKTKCKVDGLKFDDFMIDLKTTGGSVKDFISSSYKYNYDQQAAFYMDTVGVSRFIFIVVEKNYPYNVGVFTCGDSFIERGRISYKNSLADLNYYMTKPNFDVESFYFRDILV